MDNNTTKKSIPSIYRITGIIAFVLSVLLVIFSIYDLFFYKDGSWAHGVISNGFSLLNELFWLGILFIFMRFLNTVLNYKKANTLIILYLVFSIIMLYSLAKVLLSTLMVQNSLNGNVSFNDIDNYASSSIWSVILLMISGVAMLIVCLALGNRIRKIDVVNKNLFTALGWSFIMYGIFSILQLVTVLEYDAVPLVIKAIMIGILGYILKNTSSKEVSALSTSLQPEVANIPNLPKDKPPLKEVSAKKEDDKNYIANIIKLRGTRGEEAKKELDEVPKLNVEQLENKDILLSYYENLPKEELKRLRYIVSKKYNQNLSEEQINDLVILYIEENKLYDHQRFGPK